jgi:hypothetical protein
LLTFSKKTFQKVKNQNGRDSTTHHSKQQCAEFQAS